MSGNNSALKSQQRFYMSRDAETDFGEGTGAAITHSLHPISGISSLRRGRNMKDNSDQSTGHQGATVTTPLEYFLAPPPVVVQMDAHALGLVMGHFMSLDTVTASGVGAHAHAFTEGVQGTFPGSFVCSGKIRSGGDTVGKSYWGCYIESWEISGGTTDFIQLSMKIAGSGHATNQYLGVDGVVPVGKFPAHKTKISILPIVSAGTSPWSGAYVPPTTQGVFANTLSGAGVLDLSEHGIKSWKMSGSLNVDEASKLQPGITDGVGSYQGCPQVGRRSYGLEVTVESNPITQGLVYNYEDQTIAAQAHYAVMIEFVTDLEIGSSGRYHSGALVLPLGQLKQLTPSDEDRVTETLSFESFSPTAGTPTDLFYAFSLDEDSAAYGG